MNAERRHLIPEPGAQSDEEPRGKDAGTQVVTVSSQSVMAGRGEIRIDHNGEVYRLRVTNSGKLILTK